MKFLASASKAAFLGAQVASRNALLLGTQYPQPLARSAMVSTSSAFTAPSRFGASRGMHSTTGSSSRLFSSSGGIQDIQLRNIGKEEMEEIVEDYEGGGREQSGYLIMDVREVDEIIDTGKVSPNTQTLPLSLISAKNVFAMDEEEFEENCGFPKPSPDETLVFSCRSGVRSVKAAQFAAMNGYTQLVNYKGGALEWFS